MVPVVKATNCLFPHPRRAAAPAWNRPASVAVPAPMPFATPLPQELYWYSRVKEYDKAEKLNLFDCIECGACAWVCPSETLVQYHKIAKDDIREARAEAEKAERWQRFEAKQACLSVRRRPAKPATPRPQPSVARPATTAGAKDPVAAAPARIKAKQETAQVAVSEPAPDNEAMIAAREARKQEAIARRAAKAANGEGKWAC